MAFLEIVSCFIKNFGNYDGFKYFLKIDPSAILQKSLDRALVSYICMQDVRSSGVRASLSCKFENSTKCGKVLFDSDSSLE